MAGVDNRAMTHTKTPLSFRMMLHAGWIAIQTAFLGSVAFSIGVIIIQALATGVSGFHVLIDPDPYFGLPSVVTIFYFLLAPPFAISILPAFLGGIILARIYSYTASQGKLTLRNAVRSAALTGFMEGLVLSLIISPIIVWMAMHPAHNMAPPAIRDAVLSAIPYALLIIIMSSLVGTLAGKWIAKSYLDG